MRQAIEFWHNNSCVSFVEDPNGDSALRIFSVSVIFNLFEILNQELNGIERDFQGAGCYASLGRQGTKTQDVSIGNGCDNVREINSFPPNHRPFQLGTATHELNHALGFFHTMSRPDRDR